MKSALILAALIIECACSGGLKAGEPEYVGSNKCKACHIKQYKSWETSRMAAAFEVLKAGKSIESKKAQGLDPDIDYTTKDKCLSCHTTGFGKPGGFENVEKTPNLVGVGCESCHGPGSEYIKQDLMSLQNKDHSFESVRNAGLIYPPTGETCISLCHNENSPFINKDQKFDFEEKKDQGIHESLPLKYKHE